MRQPTVPSNLGQPLSVSECYVNYSATAQKGPARLPYSPPSSAVVSTLFVAAVVVGKAEKADGKTDDAPVLRRPLVKLNAVISFLVVRF